MLYIAAAWPPSTVLGVAGIWFPMIEERTWVQTPIRGGGTFPEAGEGDWARLAPRTKGREEVAAYHRAEGGDQRAKS